jgi:dienelactone hydrolase
MQRKFVSLITVLAITVSISCLTTCASTNFRSQKDAPGDPVLIPGIELSGLGKVSQVPARFSLPAGTTSKVPAVLILHGSAGVDGRGAFYAQALLTAGIATLEITMFPPGARPRESVGATIPYAAAALKWLGEQQNVNRKRLGVLGFSWGGALSVLMASELVQERLGKEVPRPAAFAPFYPCCSLIVRYAASPKSAFYETFPRMSETPMLIHVGTQDDYEVGRRPCDALVAMWPSAARAHTIVRYVEFATHGFDMQDQGNHFYDRFSHGGQGGWVRIAPSPEDAAEARKEVLSFFIKHLKP